MAVQCEGQPVRFDLGCPCLMCLASRLCGVQLLAVCTVPEALLDGTVQLRVNTPLVYVWP
jgi:hypothetical protein